MAVKKVSRDRLVKAAEELNKVLGLEPEIDVEQEEEELEEAILEASELLEPEDELSKATLKVINDLTALAEAYQDEAAATAEEEEEEEEEESEPAVEEKEEPASKKESKPAPKKPAPKKDERKMTRPQALARALMLMDGPFTAEQIVRAAHKIYEAANRIREEHMRGSKAEWDVVYRAFLAIGVLEVNEGTNPRTFIYKGPRL